MIIYQVLYFSFEFQEIRLILITFFYRETICSSIFLLFRVKSRFLHRAKLRFCKIILKSNVNQQLIGNGTAWDSLKSQLREKPCSLRSRVGRNDRVFLLQEFDYLTSFPLLSEFRVDLDHVQFNAFKIFRHFSILPNNASCNEPIS